MLPIDMMKELITRIYKGKPPYGGSITSQKEYDMRVVDKSIDKFIDVRIIVIYYE